MQDLKQHTTAETSRLPFSPLTTTGLSVLVEEQSSTWVHLINTRRIGDPRVSAAAQLISAMCRAHTDRILADLQQLVSA